ncbi:MAG: ABC transporter permease [Rhodocyclaceae bacterium]|nr:ABC transporter permease [Rhodocyclaceae bacterium]
MVMKPVLLVSDALFFMLLAALAFGAAYVRRTPHLAAGWRAVGKSSAAMASLTLLTMFLVIAVLDSLHYRERLPGPQAHYAPEVRSALDALLAPLRLRQEKTYSAPLALHSFAKETSPDGHARDFPRLRHGGSHLGDDLDRHMPDVLARGVRGAALGLILWGCLWGALALLARRAPNLAWPAVRTTLLVVALCGGVIYELAQGYHVFGTDKVGQDVLYLTLKSIRTALLIGTLTTLIMLPAAVVLGLAAGYFGGWIDDLIQYLYTTLNSIPGVLLIAAAVLMMQVAIEAHPQWFATAAERADARMVMLCAILGLTSWTGLCRLLRGEALKLRELDFVAAARALGLPATSILLRHILPNVMHIVMIAIVMDFSALVLAEAVLSYVGIGVDPHTISFGTMINAARLELAREPVVWWSLAAAFVFMLTLVLAANLLADAVREAFDPRREQPA